MSTSKVRIAVIESEGPLSAEVLASVFEAFAPEPAAAPATSVVVTDGAPKPRPSGAKRGRKPKNATNGATQTSLLPTNPNARTPTEGATS